MVTWETLSELAWNDPHICAAHWNLIIKFLLRLPYGQFTHRLSSTHVSIKKNFKIFYREITTKKVGGLGWGGGPLVLRGKGWQFS